MFCCHWAIFSQKHLVTLLQSLSLGLSACQLAWHCQSYDHLLKNGVVGEKSI
jgi:hypothetical protein